MKAEKNSNDQSTKLVDQGTSITQDASKNPNATRDVGGEIHRRFSFVASSGIFKKRTERLSIILIVGGMLMLLAAWVSQQVLYEKWREKLADIAIGESIFNSFASAYSFFELL